MASDDLVVLIVVLSAGLLLGLLLAWVTLLRSTGHPPRRHPREVPSRPPPRRLGEDGASRALLGAFLALAGVAILALLLVPDVRGRFELPEDPLVDVLPLALSFAALIVAMAFALPEWLGVRR